MSSLNSPHNWGQWSDTKTLGVAYPPGSDTYDYNYCCSHSKILYCIAESLGGIMQVIHLTILSLHSCYTVHYTFYSYYLVTIFTGHF